MQVALAHYRKCKAAGSMYVGVYFNAIDEEAMGYELIECTNEGLLSLKL